MSYQKLSQFIKSIHPKAILLRVPKGHMGQIATNLNHLSQDWDDAMKSNKMIKKTQIISGFLNIFVNDAYICEPIYQTNIPKTNIEYCSPNPTGQLHLGHLEGIVNGKVLCNLYKQLGLPYSSEIYINNLGSQVESFRQSVQDVKEGREPSVYSNPIIYKWAKSDRDPVELQVEETLETLKNTFNINYHKISYESDQIKYMDQVFQVLSDNKMLFKGSINGQKVEGDVDYYQDPQGNHHVLRRSNGQFTYYAMDLCYALDKKSRGFNRQICFMGDDHKGHIFRMKSALDLFGIEYIGVTMSLLKFKKDGKEILFSKRSGNAINIVDLKCSSDQITSAILNKRSHKNMICNLEKFENESKSTEILLLANKINNLDIKFNQKIVDNDILNLIIGDVIFFNKILEDALKKHDPHIIFDNCYKLTMKLNNLFEKYNLQEISAMINLEVFNQIKLIINTYTEILYK